MIKPLLALGGAAFLAELRRAIDEGGVPNALEAGDLAFAGAAVRPAAILLEEGVDALRFLIKARMRPALRDVPAVLWVEDVDRVSLPTSLDLAPLNLLVRPVRWAPLAALRLPLT